MLVDYFLQLLFLVFADWYVFFLKIAAPLLNFIWVLSSIAVELKDWFSFVETTATVK